MEAMETFIARQPIFDRHQKVYAYELLFRSGLDNVFDYPDPNQATAKVIAHSFSLLGIDSIAGGKLALINLTREVLLKEYITLLPNGLFAAEILENVEPDAAVIAVCRRLKQAGYTLALDDFVGDERYRPLVELADIIKVDFLATSPEARKDMRRRFARGGIRFLAEKVETREAFQEALDTGYSYFQGYFFSKPSIVARKEVPAFKLNLFRVMQAINRPELDFRQLEDIIKHDASLTYKLLCYINSAFFGLRYKITSLIHALVLLGEHEVRKLISLIALTTMGKDKPEELAVLAAIRAKFCESLAPLIGLAHRSHDLFLLGMFSLIDVIVDQPLPDILQMMPLADDVKAALLGEDNHVRAIYEFSLAYERGAWEQVSALARRLGLSEVDSPLLYRRALEWCQQSFQGGLLTRSPGLGQSPLTKSSGQRPRAIVPP
jgi:c-di-GMP-related signal transduction protein